MTEARETLFPDAPKTPATHFVPPGDVPKVERTRRYFAELRASLRNALDVSGDVLHSWQQTADAAEMENAAWRGWADDVSRFLHAIDKDLSVSVGGKVYPQHVYARMLASRLREIRERRS